MDYLNSVEAAVLLESTPATIINHIHKGIIPARVENRKKYKKYYIPSEVVYKLRRITITGY